MTYRIYKSEGINGRRTVAEVVSMERAKEFLAAWGEIICFQIDDTTDTKHPAADCALERASGMLEIYAVEPY